MAVDNEVDKGRRTGDKGRGTRDEEQLGFCPEVPCPKSLS